MTKQNQQTISQQSQEEALSVAKATQKKGQNKAQTKLIAQGIEKGISEYKKQQKAKARERDKQRKQLSKAKQVKAQQEQINLDDFADSSSSVVNKAIVPWSLLIVSWLAFAVYFFV